jgi:hypothetical protein
MAQPLPSHQDPLALGALLAAVSTSSTKTNCLALIPVHTCDHAAIRVQGDGVFKSLLSDMIVETVLAKERIGLQMWQTLTKSENRLCSSLI